MKNNTLGKISVASGSRSNTYKDKSSDLHITLDFGSVVPGKMERIYSNSSFRIGHRERMVLTSLVAPCFGRIQLKSIDYFVRMSDVFKNYPAMMAQEPVYRNGQSFVPQCMPCVPVSHLSLAVLFGAQMTIYKVTQSGDVQYADLYKMAANLQPNTPLNALSQEMQAACSDLGIASSTQYGLQGALSIPMNYLLNKTGSAARLPLSNPQYGFLFDAKANHPDWTYFGSSPVTLQGADYVLSVKRGTNKYLLAFRLSSFGRRLRKVLIGCGWQFDVNNDEPFNLVRLVAYYTAYWHNYAPVLFENFEETYCYKLMSIYDNEASPIHSMIAPSSDAFASTLRDFLFLELGCCYYTDEQDFVSAHTRQPAVSPSQQAYLDRVKLDIAGDPNIVDNNTPNQSDTIMYAAHAYINGVQHGQLDSKILKRLYRQTNVNTIAGRVLEKLLRVQGLGLYVDSVKPSFIASHSVEVPIYDLPAQSDTYSRVNGQESGMRLGEYGAYSSLSKSHGQESFIAEEDGYYINLITVVPVGGYGETIDPDAVATTKYEQPTNGEFDSLGMEMSPKFFVQGSQPWATDVDDVATAGKLSDAFGMVPTYFSFKFAFNKVNGDFSLRSTRSTYRGWYLDKVIQVNEPELQAWTGEASDSYGRTVIVSKGLSPVNLPIAGNVWRYPTRYEWIGSFRRIFYNDSNLDPSVWNLQNATPAQYEYFALADDNFILHMIHEMPAYDSLLPVQDSFETYDDERKANSSMSKA